MLTSVFLLIWMEEKTMSEEKGAKVELSGLFNAALNESNFAGNMRLELGANR